MILKKMMVCIAAVCCCGGVLGVGETLVPVFPPAGKISVLPGTAPEQVEFPAVPPKKDYGVALRFDARIVTPTSPKTASHIFEIPTAERIRIAPFIPNEPIRFS